MSDQDDTVIYGNRPLPEAPLLADLLQHIDGFTDWPSEDREDAKSAVRGAIRICGLSDSKSDPDQPLLPPTSSAAYLNTKLFRKPPAVYGYRKERFANILSLLRKTLRRTGSIEEKWGGADTLADVWRALFNALPTQHRQIALSAFFRFCSDHGTAPDDVTSEVLVAFEAHLLNRTLCRDAPVRARAVASNWTWACTHVAGWPDRPIKRERMRGQYVLSLDIFGPELRADVERFLQRLAFNKPEDIFDDDSPNTANRSYRWRRSLSPRTIAGRLFQIRQVLSAMVIEGRDPATVTSLRDIVDSPEQVKAILRFFLARSGNKPTSQTGQIGELLRQLARFHCKLDDEAVARITELSKRVAPQQDLAVTDKNMARLNSLLQPRTRLMFLNLPRTLMRETEKEGKGSRDGALKAMHAIALDILLAFPLRRSNLAELHLDDHLQRTDPRRKLVDFINISTTKTGKSLTWPIPQDLAIRLETYLRTYRPLLTVPGNRHLFPKTAMGHRSAHDLAQGLTRLVEERLGVEFNVHLVRHFAVALHLESHPGQYDTARQFLGHAKTSHTIAVYDSLGTILAARQLDATLRHQRRALSSEAKPEGKAKIRRKRPSPGKRPPHGGKGDQP